MQLGFLHALRGMPFESIAMIRQAMQINPLHPDWYYQDLSLANYLAGNYAEAIRDLSKLPGKSAWKLVRQAAAHALLGNAETAGQLIRDIRAGWPDFSIMDFAGKGIAFEHGEDGRHFLDGVMKAVEAADGPAASRQ